MIQEIVQGIRAELLGTMDHTDVANYMNEAPARDDEISQLQCEIASLKSTISSLKDSQRSTATPPPMFVPTESAYYSKSSRNSQSHTDNTDTSTISDTRTLAPRRVKYCWTHGVCFHDSKSCERKAQNHEDSATLHNRKGGSTKGLKRYNRMRNN